MCCPVAGRSRWKWINFHRACPIHSCFCHRAQWICCYLQVFRSVSLVMPLSFLILAYLHHSPGNHTVTQSSFSSPCEPLSGGFDSGWIYVPQGISSGFPVWNLTITDDSKRKHHPRSTYLRARIDHHFPAIWYYCKQLVPAPHCNQGGMVG